MPNPPKIEIPAENGFIYVIDQVMIPPVNAEEYLRSIMPRLHFQVPRNDLSDAGLSQTLKPPLTSRRHWQAAYLTPLRPECPALTFNIHEELDSSQYQQSKLGSIQNRLLAPTDQALDRLIQEVITSGSGYPHWPNWEVVPNVIKRIIVNTHMSEIPSTLPISRRDF